MVDSTQKQKVEKQWIRIRLVDQPKRGRRRLVKLGNGFLRFNASQTDPKAMDFPTKVALLAPEDVERFKGDPDYEVHPAQPPAATAAGKQITPRKIGAAPAAPEPATTTPPKPA